MNVNALMGAPGMGIVRLVWSTIGKTAPALTAGKQETKTRIKNKGGTTWLECAG